MTGADLLPATVLKRKAVVYVRQSTQTQVQTNLESQRRHPEREELFEQRAGAAVRQQGAHLGEGALILRRAPIRHDPRGRGEGPARRHAASARTERGARTSTTPNSDASRRRRMSFSGR